MPYGFRVAFVKIRRGSNMAIFTGAGVAIVTPFKEDESIDYDRLDELIDFHWENGTDSIVICGTSGETRRYLFLRKTKRNRRGCCGRYSATAEDVTRN